MTKLIQKKKTIKYAKSGTKLGLDVIGETLFGEGFKTLDKDKRSKLEKQYNANFKTFDNLYKDKQLEETRIVSQEDIAKSPFVSRPEYVNPIVDNSTIGIPNVSPQVEQQVEQQEEKPKLVSKTKRKKSSNKQKSLYEQVQEKYPEMEFTEEQVAQFNNIKDFKNSMFNPKSIYADLQDDAPSFVDKAVININKEIARRGGVEFHTSTKYPNMTFRLNSDGTVNHLKAETINGVTYYTFISPDGTKHGYTKDGKLYKISTKQTIVPKKKNKKQNYKRSGQDFALPYRLVFK